MGTNFEEGYDDRIGSPDYKGCMRLPGQCLVNQNSQNFNMLLRPDFSVIYPNGKPRGFLNRIWCAEEDEASFTGVHF